MADFSNNVGSNIVFNADSFKIDDKLSKGAKYVSSNSSSSGSDVETVDFDEWDNQKKGSNSSSGVRSNFVYQKVGQDVEHNGNADHDAWEKQREEEEKKPLTDYFSNYIDINHDGKVDKDDLRYFTGELKSNSVDAASLKLYGDINGDSVFDENDKMIIQSYINGDDVTQSVDMDYLSFKKSVIDSSKNKNIDIAGALDQKDFNYESSDESILKIYFEKNADFNGDGKIDKEDVRLFNLGSNEVSNISSDFNGDGKVDEKDRKIFSRYVNGENVADQINKNAALAAAYKKDFNAYNKQAKDLAAYKKELVDAKNKADQEGGGGEEEFKRQYGMSYDEYNKFIKVIDKRINNINYKKKSANVKYKKYVEKNNIAGDLKDFKHDTSAYWQKIDYEGLYKYYKKGGRLADYPDILKLYEAGEGVDWYAIIEYFQIEKGELLKDSSRGLPSEYKCFNAMTDEQIKKYHDIFKNKGDEAAEEYIGELNKDDKLIYDFEKAEGEAGCAFFVKYDHYKFLSDDQKKYFKYLHDTKGKAAAEEYLASVEPFEGMKRRIEDNSIDKINQRTDEDFVKSYLKKKADYNGDGKIDIKDYQKLMNIHSNYVDIKDANTDLNGDGLFNSADLELLNNYLKSGDISGIVGSYDYIKYKAKEQLAEYKKYRDNLEDAAEKIRNYDLDDLSETDRENMLNEISEQITMFNSLIISQKKVVDRLPYLNLTYTDDYKKFDKNYVEKLKNNKKLEEIYKNYKENPLYGFPDGVDKLEIIDYLINIKGEDPETVLSKFGEETKYYRYLTDDQQMMYHYLYKTKGAEAAEKYAKVLEDDIIRQEAMDEIKSQIDALDIKIERDKDGNIIKQSLDSTAWNELNAMLKGFGEGITDDFNSISKWGKDGYTKDEYKKMYYLQYLQSNGLLEGLYNGGKIAGNLTRSIAISTAITLAFPENMATTAALVAAGVNTAISTAAAGAEAQHSALVEGYSTKTANEYAKQIMTNNVVLDLTSTAIGYGIVPTIQFSNAIRGVSTISKAARYSTTLVNTLSGSAIAALSVHRQQRLREVYLNKSTIDADQESEAMVNAFIQSMVMAAVSSGINKTFTVIKNGVKKKLSTNDYLEYTKNADNPSEEGFVKTQFDGDEDGSVDIPESERRSYWNKHFNNSDDSNIRTSSTEVTDSSTAKTAFNEYQDFIDAELKKDNPDLRAIAEYQSRKNDLNQKYHLEEQYQLASAEKGASKRFTTAAEPKTKEIANAISDFRNKTRETRKVKVGDKYFETDLTDAELVKFANDYFGKEISSIDEYPDGFGVPKSSDYVKISPSDGKMSVVWGENDGALYGVNSGDASLKKGSYIARVGNSNGINVCSYENAESVDYSNTSSRRGLPWAEGSATNTTWSVEKDITASSVLADLEKLQTTNPSKFKDIMGDITYDLYGNSGIEATLKDIKCLTGLIAPDFGGVGLDTQYTLPIRTSHLEYLGYIKKV